MRIKLTQEIKCGPDTCSVGEEYEAVLILPRSTTVEFEVQSGRKVRAFNYEYTKVEVEADA
ncbi:hypothetical protein [Colwellia sp. E2M01]|uniref:hypothetical protein n=1 Tax=Colwellia sp. E2M01 TaxID=2841561 RepID=UPI001C092587|nr:hypothetical protein [Colwellia sp. E2M01]MBU2872337.1 hypothetical protein [Colwellia sp. E2M01]